MALVSNNGVMLVFDLMKHSTVVGQRLDWLIQENDKKSFLLTLAYSING
jgi:hypothetical protein